MVHQTPCPDLNATLDEVLATTASTLVLILTPRGELAAYRGPADLTTAARIVHILDRCIASSAHTPIQHILLDTLFEGNCYFASLPREWTLLLVDQAALSAARLRELTAVVVQASVALAQQLLQSEPAALMQISVASGEWSVSTAQTRPGMVC